MDQETQLDLQRHSVRLQRDRRFWHFSNLETAVVTGWHECSGSLEDFEVLDAGRWITWGEKRAAFSRAMAAEGAAV